ncbi:MAG: hypothetical protein AABY34_05445 [Pseudomonadota bacterium]|mgnify:FL=1
MPRKSLDKTTLLHETNILLESLIELVTQKHALYSAAIQLNQQLTEIKSIVNSLPIEHIRHSALLSPFQPFITRIPSDNPEYENDLFHFVRTKIYSRLRALTKEYKLPEGDVVGKEDISTATFVTQLMQAISLQTAPFHEKYQASNAILNDEFKTLRKKIIAGLDDGQPTIASSIISGEGDEEERAIPHHFSRTPAAIFQQERQERPAPPIGSIQPAEKDVVEAAADEHTPLAPQPTSTAPQKGCCSCTIL